MSIWYDNQSKPLNHFHKLLQWRIDKGNLCRNLTTKKAQHLAKFKTIAEKIKRVENVQNHQLKAWLSED